MMYNVEDIIVLNTENEISRIDENGVKFCDGSYIDASAYGFDRFAKVEIELWQLKALMNQCEGSINYKETEEKIAELIEEAKDETALEQEEEYEEKIIDLEDKIANLEYDIADLKEEIESLENENTDLKDKIEELESNNE